MPAQSSMIDLGFELPDFELPDCFGNKVASRASIGENGLLVVFMCNHCPYVKHVSAGLAQLARDLADLGVPTLGINSNDPEQYPDDDVPSMRAEVERRGYTFPYLVDAEQDVARAFSAACTPDFFLFNREGRLVYRGQMDGSRPGNNVPNDGRDLRRAVDAMLKGEILKEQLPSMGCSIKWKHAGGLNVVSGPGQ